MNGHKGVCIDSTHDTTAFNFLLTSIVVMGDFGSGFPVARCLANHDTTMMTIFFDQIKKVGGVISPVWLTSIIANQFYNAWVRVVKNRPIKLICTGHPMWYNNCLK